jgi:hypothetical protein
MSFHHINLQKESLRTNARQPASNNDNDEDNTNDSPPTPFVAFSTSVVIGGMVNLSPPNSATDHNQDDEEMISLVLSEVDSQYFSTKSWWADISEVDSVSTRKSSSDMLSIASRMGLDGEEEEDEDDGDGVKMSEQREEDKPRGAAFATPTAPHNTLPTGIHEHDDHELMMPLQEGENTDSQSIRQTGIRDDYQSCGDSTVEEGSFVTAHDRSSLEGASGSSMRWRSSKQRYRISLQEAEFQASQAKLELEIVQRQLETLQKRQLTERGDLQRDMVLQQAVEHELRMEIKSNESEYRLVRDRLMDAVQENKALAASVEQQIAAMDTQTLEHQAKVESLVEQLRAAEQAKVTAETKLEEALERVDALQKQLEERMAAKSVRFSEQNNEVFMFRSTDYACRVAQSESENEELTLQLRSMQVQMEGLEESHTSLQSLYEEAMMRHEQELTEVKQLSNHARSQVRELLSSLVEMQHSAERKENERLVLEEKLETTQDAQENAAAKLMEKEKDFERIEREMIKINVAIARMATMQDDDSSPVNEADGSGRENLLDELEKARFRLEEQAAFVEEERKSLQDIVANATSQYSKISDQLVVMELEKKELMQQLEERKRTVLALQEERKRVNEQNILMGKALAEQQAIMVISQTRVQDLEMERATLQEELSTLQESLQQHPPVDAHVEVLRSIEMEDRTVPVVEYPANDEANLAEERQQLRAQVEHCNRLESELDQIRLELDTVRKEMASLESAHAEEMKRQILVTQKAQTMADEASIQVQQLQEYYTDTLIDLRKAANREFVLLRQRNSLLEDEKSAMETEIDALKNDVARLIEEKTIMASEHKQAVEERISLALIDSSRAKKVEQEHDAFHKQIDALLSEQARLENKLRATAAMWKEATAQLLRKQTRIRELEEKLVASDRSISVLQNETNEVLYKLETFDSISEASSFELEIDLSAFKTKMHLLDREKSDAIQELECEKIEFDDLRQAKSEELISIEEEMARTRAQLNAATDQVSILLKENEDPIFRVEVSSQNIVQANDENNAAALDQVKTFRVEREHAVLAEVGLQRLAQELQEKLDAESRKVKKLAKILKRMITNQKRATANTSLEMHVLALLEEIEDLTLNLDVSSEIVVQANEEKALALKQVNAFRVERERAVLAAHAEVGLRDLARELHEKLDVQTKKVKKLAKVLKRELEKEVAASANDLNTCNGSDDEQKDDGNARVSRMPITLSLRYHSKKSGLIEKMNVSAEYTGPLVDGEPDGPGMLRFESGDLYLGEFKNGEMNGTGSYVRRRPPRDGDSMCLSGMFANNEFIFPISPASTSFSEFS